MQSGMFALVSENGNEQSLAGLKRVFELKSLESANWGFIPEPRLEFFNQGSPSFDFC